VNYGLYQQADVPQVLVRFDHDALAQYGRSTGKED